VGCGVREQRDGGRWHQMKGTVGKTFPAARRHAMGIGEGSEQRRERWVGREQAEWATLVAQDGGIMWGGSGREIWGARLDLGSGMTRRRSERSEPRAFQV
jgi:hypothetical protein